MAYYNTTNETGESLTTNVVKAQSQKVKILLGMKYCTNIYPRFKTSSSTILSAEWCSEKTPITSIRRALTNLVSEGDLVYTGEMRMADKGRTEKIVKLNTNK